MEIQDEELMLAVAASGDEAAFHELMRRYRQELVNHFARRGVQQVYEDLAQETFVRLYKARRRYKVRAQFRTYLYHIAHRVWVDHIRKSARRQRREQAFAAEPRTASVSAPGVRRADVAWALAKLRPPHRDVVVLSLLDECSHAEIAARLGIPEGTVKSRLHTALQQLRQFFQEEDL